MVRNNGGIEENVFVFSNLTQISHREGRKCKKMIGLPAVS
jgi:hypothetical protein